MKEAKKDPKLVARIDAKEQAEKRIKDLIDGREPPPNPFVEYMLDKLRVSRKEFDELGKNVQQTRAALEAMEKRLLVVQGEHNKYLEDIRVWDRKLDEKGEPVVVPALAAVPTPDVDEKVVPPEGATEAQV
jgi:hypothetical protein